MLLWTLAAALAREPRGRGAVPEYFLRALRGRVELRVPPEGASVSSHSADRTSSGVAGVAAPALAAAVAALPGRSAGGNGEGLTTTAARTCPAIADDADDADGKGTECQRRLRLRLRLRREPHHRRRRLLPLLRSQAALVTGLAAGGSVCLDGPCGLSSGVVGARSWQVRQAPEAREAEGLIFARLRARSGGPGLAMPGG